MDAVFRRPAAGPIGGPYTTGGGSASMAEASADGPDAAMLLGRRSPATRLLAPTKASTCS
ncbi:hypothetical protein ACU4GD_42180 [Cupriavidus basilensis]